MIWHGKESEGTITDTVTNSDTDTIDLKILTCLSMNARMPVPKIAKLAGINEQTAYSRIKSLEKRLGIKYILEIDTRVLGFATYLILVKFEDGVPPIDELRGAFDAEPRIQFAAFMKGDYDAIAYLLDEDSFSAEETLWKLMSGEHLSRYRARWYMVPFGQIYSFVPLRTDFIDKVLSRRQWHRKRFVTIDMNKADVLKREYLLLKELSTNAAMNLSDIDTEHGLGKGASRYTFHQLKEEGIIVRPTITIQNIPLKYIGMLMTETISPAEVARCKSNLRIEELRYGYLLNRYALIGNTSMPESVVFFMPVTGKDELLDATSNLSHINGTVTRSSIIAKVLVGELCYRRFDNVYSIQYPSLLRERKIQPQEMTEYE